MHRSAAVIGSIAVHAVVLFVVLVVRETEKPRVITELVPQVAITEVDVVAQLEKEPIEAAPGRGGGGGGGIPHEVSPTRARLTTATNRTTSVASYLGRVVMVGGRGGSDTGADGGSGGGRGGGTGRGFGLGTGSGVEGGAMPPPPPPPPPPVISKARPPILIFPRRTADVDDDAELFVARVKIDDDGYVVGAKLLQGVGPQQNLDASEQIFRFRYLPALDDAGKPISWTLDQPFLVQ